MNRATLKVSPEWFAGMLKCAVEGDTRRYDVVEHGLPSDVRVVSVRMDETGYAATIFILLESNSFPETEEGDEPPILDSPVFRVYLDETLV